MPRRHALSWRLPSIYDGGSRSDAARLGNVTLQIVRDWVLRFNAHGPDGLINGKAPGPKSRLDDTQRAALAQAMERGPAPYLDGVVRWRLCDLVQWLWHEFGVSVSEQTLSGRCVPWGTASSPHGQSIMRRTLKRWRSLKKLSRSSGASRRWSRQRQAARNLVSR